MKKILFILFLAVGFLFFFSFTPKTEAFKITMLSKIPGQRIVKDYKIFIYEKGEFFRINGVLHQPLYITLDNSLSVNLIKFITNDAPSGANACVSLRLRPSVVYCQYVKLVPKK